MSNISEKPRPADHAKTKAQLLVELNELRQRIAQLETTELLTQSEERYRSVVTAMAEGVVMLQRSGEIVACNPAAEQILGLSRDQMMGRTTLDPRWRAIRPDGTLFPGETHPVTITLQTGQPQRNVIMGVHKPDDSLTWILINSEPMVQPGASQPYAVVATFTDITHQRQNEESLRQNEQKFRQVVEQSNDAIILYDESGRLVEMNPAAERLSGLEQDKALGQMIWDIQFGATSTEWRTPDVYEQLQTEWLAYFQTGQHPSLNRVIELEMEQPDGTRRMVQTARFSIKTERGYRLGAVIRDVTEYKRLEAALRESKERLDMVIKAADLGTWDWHAAGDQVMYNEHWAEMLSYSLTEIEPTLSGWENLVHPEDSAGVRTAVEAHLAGNTSLYQTEQRLRSKSGEWKWVLATGQVVERDEHGQPLRAVGIHQDITARKQAEQMVRDNEARFRAVLANNDIVVFDHDQELCYTHIYNPNPNFTAAGILGKTDADLFLPADAARLTEIKRRVLATGSGERQVVQNTLGGEIFYYDLTVEPKYDAAGQTMGVACAAMNITERTQAEDELRRSEAIQRAVLEAIPDFMFWTDRQGNYIPFHEFKSVSSAPTSGISVKKLNEALPQNVAEGILSRIALTYETGEVQTFEYSLALQGEIRYYEASLVNTLLDEILCILRDITARRQAEEALRQSEQKFRQIIEHSGDGIMLTNETGRIVEWNPTLEQITDLHRADVMGQPSWEILFNLLPAERRTPDIYNSVKAASQAYFQTGQDPWVNEVAEFELQRPDGSYRDIQTVDFSTQTERGFGRGSVTRDITEHKQLERIEAAQLAVSRILAGSPEPAVALRQILESIAGRLKWELAKLWWPNDDGSRLVWQEGWRVPDQPELAAFEQVSQGHTFESGEGLAGMVWQTGQAIWDESLRLPKLAEAALTAGLHSATGIPIIEDEVTVGVMTFFSRSARPLEERLLVTLTDLGRQIGQFLARKEAEETLCRYEQMVATSPDLLSLVDRNYIYRIVNQTYLTLNNKTYEQIVGHLVAEVLGEAMFAKVIKPRIDQGLAGEKVQYQAWFDFPAGGERFLDVTYTPYREKEGTSTGVVVSARDITEAKLLEEHLQQVQKMGVIGQLAAGMAHHYNSMLTGIIGFTSLSLRALPSDSPVAKNLERVLNTAERMAVLVRQLLAFAQKQLLQFKTTHLNEWVRQFQDQLKQAVPTPIEFALNLAPEVGEVRVDPGQFEYLLLALVSNAVDAMPDGGQLTLSTTNVSLGPVEADWYELPPGDYALLTVKDTGIGLSDEVKAHLFEPFFTTKDVGQGTGLGLAMSLGIAKQHGGHLLAESEHGQGATFMLYLPCLAPPPTLPPVRSTAAGIILLVEAEPIVREFVAEILSDEGYTVLKATTTEVAQERMAGQPEVSLQLLLTPAHSNSPALIEQLKANSPGLKVIFLIDEVEDLSFELKGTKADFLLKPFAPSSLVQKIRAVLETAPE